MLLLERAAYAIRCLLHDQLLLVGLAAVGQTGGKVDGPLGAARRQNVLPLLDLLSVCLAA